MPPALHPSPAAECLEPYILLFKFKLLLPLDAEHLLEQGTLWIPDLHFLVVEATGQWRSASQPAGMASEGARIPRKVVPKAQGTCGPQQPLETKTPKDIPPGALKGYMDIMDKLVRLALSAPGPSDGESEEDRKESQQEEGGTYLDPGLLSYIDKLCSQEDFVIKVEEVIHPQFLAQLLSPEAQLDVLALAEDLLEQEKLLTAVQLVEERLLASKEEEGMQAPLIHDAPQLDSSPSESAASQESQKYDRGPQQGVNDKASPPETDFKDCQSHGQANTYLSKPKAFAVSSGHQECSPLRAQCPHFAPQGQRHTYFPLGPRAASIPREASPVRETCRPVGRSSENEEDLPSLSFLWASPNSLLPPELSLDPVPASGLACPGVQGPQGAALSQRQKRKCDQSVTGSWRKRHCSQYGAVGCPSHCQTLGGPAKM
ncbi:hypothetical protein HJG60_011279 [Phyllostomus discolor]|uniref:Nuclear Testis protein N-terminal domain-containing protein n=1 Tax=Phyllostomus discolor TaxID=89673 RepID=A0A834E5D5_9CHIR|nr:hypothetical protein HJG60_011279 [Phyllostomus discolor]